MAARTRVLPTGVERTFDPEELIVTKTDLKGIVTYANDTFLRLSIYDEGDVVGQPHNVIRHPEMPRCVFKLIWDTIMSEREIFAYVMNLAADGSAYWVLAHVTPTRDTAGRVVGYHSNRRLPAPSAVDAVRPLYAMLRAEERRHERSSDGLAASARMLQDFLGDRGKSYDQFVWGLNVGIA
jgi:PAS domain S-box-containing protein